MFRGIHSIAIDAKGRLSIPKKVREKLLVASNGELMVTVGSHASLLVFPLEEWWSTEEKILNLPNTNKFNRMLQLAYVGHATEIDMDANGRILIPPELRNYAELDRQAVLIGQGKRLEIWGEEGWRNETEKMRMEIADADHDQYSDAAKELFI